MTVLDDPPGQIAASAHQRWWALGALSLAILAVGVDGTVLSVALPTLSKALYASESDLQWFSSGYFLVLAAVMLPAGLLGDRYGRKRSVIQTVNKTGGPLGIAILGSVLSAGYIALSLSKLSPSATAATRAS